MPNGIQSVGPQASGFNKRGLYYAKSSHYTLLHRSPPNEDQPHARLGSLGELVRFWVGFALVSLFLSLSMRVCASFGGGRRGRPWGRAARGWLVGWLVVARAWRNPGGCSDDSNDGDEPAYATRDVSLVAALFWWLLLLLLVPGYHRSSDHGRLLCIVVCRCVLSLRCMGSRQDRLSGSSGEREGEKFSRCLLCPRHERRCRAPRVAGDRMSVPSLVISTKAGGREGSMRGDEVTS